MDKPKYRKIIQNINSLWKKAIESCKHLELFLSLVCPQKSFNYFIGEESQNQDNEQKKSK